MKNLLNTLLVCCLISGVAFACPPDKAKASTNVEKSTNAAIADVQFADLNLSVEGMTCAGCENKVKAALTGIDGIVETKKVCAKSDEASLTYDPSVISEEEIISALSEKTGYAIEVVKSAGMTEADASAKKECTKEAKKECTTAQKKACEKSKASADKDLEKEE